ncbi:MAG TPA: hypothetical protein VGI83_05790 [Gemmatimonadales bacterium]|jgi:hypothetical protein
MPRLGRAVPLAAIVIACNRAGSGPQPIFIDGRAVTTVGDTIVAMTRSGGHAVIVRDQRTGALRRLGEGALHSPLQVQWAAGRWYVSDLDQGSYGIVEFSPPGALERRVALDTLTRTPHQFAVLPDGRIVVEGSGRRLLAISRDSITTFARTDSGRKPGLLVAASGGVLLALPDKSITLFNAFGNVRWRIDWQWLETAFFTDVSVDAEGRIHFMAGVPSEGKFIVYSLSPINGEVVRWSEPGPYATFVVDRFGVLTPDSAANWAGK